MNLASISAAILASFSLVSSKVFLSESFDNGEWQSVWKVPRQNSNQLGAWEVSSGKFYADEVVNRGLRTLDDMHFYALTAPLSEQFTNKNGDLVVQFSAKNEQSLNCGGAYIKLISSDVNIDEFGGQTPYKIMFGPDVCGQTRRVHVILERDGQGRMIKKQIDFANDELTHMYTLVISQPSQNYRVLIDGHEVAAGSIVDDVEDMTSVPSMIPDPKAFKPSNWVEEAQIVDPEDNKPEDWDESEEWNARMIDNPEYKGDWSAPLIPNPEYKPDPTVAVFSDLAFVAFDLWQVKAGTIFDNILVTDDFSEAQRAIETVFSPFVELENAAYKAFIQSNSSNASEETENSDNTAEGEEDQLDSDSSAENRSEL